MEEKRKTPLAGVHKEFKNKVEDISDMPIVKMMNIRHNFTRVNPTIWLFLFAVIGVMVGIAFASLRLFLWVGGFIVAIFVAFFVLAHYFDKLEKSFLKLVGASS